MRLLLDTHLLVWAFARPDRISPNARGMLTDPANTIFFSSVSIWEVVIKSALNRPDFPVDAAAMRDQLLDGGFVELDMTGPHALAVAGLPRLHGDPFDRILIAQALVERIILLTADRALGGYGAPVRMIG